MAVSELQNGGAGKAFHQHHGRGGGHVCERDPFPAPEILFL